MRVVFVYFRPFLNTVTNIAQIWTLNGKSAVDVRWIRTLGLQDGRHRRIH